LSTKIVDALVFIPLIPAAPVVATWWLPWERWIPKKIPNKVVGPYLLYCSFAGWYFNMPWWFIVGVALWGGVVCIMAAFEVRKRKRREQARNWPTTEGYVTAVTETRDGDSLKVTLSYTYKVQDERYGGSEEFVFSKDKAAVHFEARFEGKGREGVKVHYQPDKPEMSVLAPETIR
jgi:Protein of unknown function (DUF3592)